MQMMSDYMLIKRIKKGDKNAFDMLVRKHYDNIFAYCFRRTGVKTIAEDLTQEIFLKLIRAVYQYNFTGKFTNYLFTIAVNTCNDYNKKKNLIIADIEIETIQDACELPDNMVINIEANSLLNDKLAMLPDIQKEALILYYYHDLKAKDIAIITGVSTSTAKSRIYQGVNKLKKMYAKEDSDNEQNV